MEKPATSCHALVDELIDCVSGERGFFGRLRAGLGLISTVQRNLKSGQNARDLAIDGFRNDLVANNQKGQAIRHIRLHAGCMLLGLPGWGMSAAFHFLDWIQAREGRAESKTEMDDNIAGRDVGWHLVDALDAGMPKEHLRGKLLGILAEGGAEPLPNALGATAGTSRPMRRRKARRLGSATGPIPR